METNLTFRNALQGDQNIINTLSDKFQNTHSEFDIVLLKEKPIYTFEQNVNRTNIAYYVCVCSELDTIVGYSKVEYAKVENDKVYRNANVLIWKEHYILEEYRGNRATFLMFRHILESNIDKGISRVEIAVWSNNVYMTHIINELGFESYLSRYYYLL